MAAPPLEVVSIVRLFPVPQSALLSSSVSERRAFMASRPFLIPKARSDLHLKALTPTHPRLRVSVMALRSRSCNSATTEFIKDDSDRADFAVHYERRSTPSSYSLTNHDRSRQTTVAPPMSPTPSPSSNKNFNRNLNHI